MKKLVREYLNEKFSEYSDDPIADMHIGGYTFETLQKGAIITTIVPHIYIAMANGRITSSKSGLFLPEDWPLFIISVRNYILKGYKEISICKPWNNTAEDIIKYRQILKETGNIASGSKVRLIINKKLFDAKFKVVENGF